MIAKEKHDPNRDADQQPIVQEETEQSKQKHNKKRKIIQQADRPDTKKKCLSSSNKGQYEGNISLFTKPTLIQEITYLLYNLMYNFFRI